MIEGKEEENHEMGQLLLEEGVGQPSKQSSIISRRTAREFEQVVHSAAIPAFLAFFIKTFFGEGEIFSTFFGEAHPFVRNPDQKEASLSDATWLTLAFLIVTLPLMLGAASRRYVDRTTQDQELVVLRAIQESGKVFTKDQQRVVDRFLGSYLSYDPDRIQEVSPVSLDRLERKHLNEFPIARPLSYLYAPTMFFFIPMTTSVALMLGHFFYQAIKDKNIVGGFLAVPAFVSIGMMINAFFKARTDKARQEFLLALHNYCTSEFTDFPKMGADTKTFPEKLLGLIGSAATMLLLANKHATHLAIGAFVPFVAGHQTWFQKIPVPPGKMTIENVTPLNWGFLGLTLALLGVNAGLGLLNVDRRLRAESKQKLDAISQAITRNENNLEPAELAKARAQLNELFLRLGPADDESPAPVSGMVRKIATVNNAVIEIVRPTHTLDVFPIYVSAFLKVLDPRILWSCLAVALAGGVGSVTMEHRDKVSTKALTDGLQGKFLPAPKKSDNNVAGVEYSNPFSYEAVLQ